MLRTLANIFAVITLALLALEVFALVAGGGWSPLSFGELWYRVHPGSLQLLQPAVERHLHPGLWDPYMQTVLIGPAFAVPLGLSVLFYALAWTFRGRKRKTLLD